MIVVSADWEVRERGEVARVGFYLERDFLVWASRILTDDRVQRDREILQGSVEVAAGAVPCN